MVALYEFKFMKNHGVDDLMAMKSALAIAAWDPKDGQDDMRLEIARDYFAPPFPDVRWGHHAWDYYAPVDLRNLKEE